MQRHPTSVRVDEPPFIKTNVPIFRMAVGRQTLYFMPDRLLIVEGTQVGAVSYRSLDISVNKTQFIEDGAAPADAAIVGRTWRYVNRDGGPDRRFNNNPQLPVCLYDELMLRTSSGLNEVVQLSQPNVAEGFAAAVRYLGATAA